jgi:cytochrome c oxidase subunit 3
MTPYVAPFFFFVYLWCNDIIKEATFEGHHTLRVQQGLRYGMVLFILSEVMFFFSFFVAYYYSSLSPAIEVFYWPPKGIDILNPLGIPLLNTVILLSSGVFITAAHKSIMQGHYIHTLIGILATIILGSIFTTLQVYEYVFATFFINDGIFGSLFFICTGFHGVHVIIGTVFLLVCLFRHLNYHFTVYWWSY